MITIDMLMESALLTEGGNNFNKAGDIHQSEIPATLKAVEKVSGLDNVPSRVLGSVGKREFSGDIDIATGEHKDNTEYAKSLYDKLANVLGNQNVKKQGSTIFALFPIVGFDQSLKSSSRTGFVQVDFFPATTNGIRVFITRLILQHQLKVLIEILL